MYNDPPELREYQQPEIHMIGHLWAPPSRYLVPQEHPEYLLHDANMVNQQDFNDKRLSVGYLDVDHESRHEADRSQ